MTTSDELTIRNPDGMFNGDSTVRVIKNCIPDILDPWQLNDVDMESVIIAIRAASSDGKMEITTTCPSCTEETKFDLDLSRMLAERKPGDYSKPLVIGDLSFHFRPLTFAESNKNGLAQFEIQREIAMIDSIEDEDEKRRVLSSGLEKLNHMMLGLVTQTLDSVKTPETTVTDADHIKEFLAECDAKTHNLIKDYSIKLKQENDPKPLTVVCPHCGTRYDQALMLNFTDFFE
jgi:hypothetical protein